MRRLLDDVTISEMRKMRESGMNNADIAQALDVGKSTVYRYIGGQGGRGGYVTKSIPVGISSQPKKEPEPEGYVGILPVVNRVTYLKGNVGEYSVDSGDKSVTMMAGDMACKMSFDELIEFAAEINAISRNLKSQRVNPEIW